MTKKTGKGTTQNAQTDGRGPEDEDLEDDMDVVDHGDLGEEEDLDDDDLGGDDDDDLGGGDDDDLGGEDEDEDDDLDDDDLGGEDDDLGDDFLPRSAPKKPKKKQTAAERISELTRKLRETERAAFEAELRASQRVPDKDAGEPEAPEAPDAGKFEYGEYDPKYIEAFADYKAEVKFRAKLTETEVTRAQQIEAQQAERYRKRLETVMASGSKRYTDFADTIENTHFSPEVARLVLDSEIAVDIAYFFGNNLKALRRITAMSPSDQARAIGRLEGRFSAPSAVRKKSKAPETPAKRGAAPSKPRKAEAKYGPDDQDSFDKAFYNL